MKRLVILIMILVGSLGFAFAQNTVAGISLYPVPLKTNELTVQLKSVISMKATSVELRNFIGKKLQTVKIEGKSEVQFTDMRQYPEGVYVVIVKDGNGKIVESAKFLITK